MKQTPNYQGLIAACGMNCGLCIGYPTVCRSCVIVNCEALKKTASGFCFECANYPCARLKLLDHRYRTKYGMSMLANLAYIRDYGVE